MEKRIKIKKYSLEKLATVSTVLSEKEQVALMGGCVYKDGYYYISQEDLVDMLGSSEAIPSHYESSMVITDCSADFSYQSFKHYYKLTPSQYHDLIWPDQSASSSNSSNSSSASSFASGSSNPSNSGSSQVFEVLPHDIESVVYNIAGRIVRLIKQLDNDGYQHLSSKAKSEMSKYFNETILSIFFTAYKKNNDIYVNNELIQLSDKTSFKCIITFQKKIESREYNAKQIVHNYSLKFPK